MILDALAIGSITLTSVRLLAPYVTDANHGELLEAARYKSFLEFHHVEPFAAGGMATVDNIELRCRAHNRYEATLFFGDGNECVRECGEAGW